MFAQEERIAISIFKKKKGKRDGQGWRIGNFRIGIDLEGV